VDEATRPETICVIVTTYNDSQFLPDALASIFSQTLPASEIIVVDDGSDRACDVSGWPGVKLIRKKNGGLSSARNAGLAATSADYILFLDADDRLTENSLADNYPRLSVEKDAAFCHGAYVFVDRYLVPQSGVIYNPVEPSPFERLLQLNTIGMHATVLYRRRMLSEIGGFDESIRLCEDYDVYLKLAKRSRLLSQPAVVAEYRRHGANISRNYHRMLEAALFVHDRHRPTDASLLPAWSRGRVNWKKFYVIEQLAAIRQGGLTARRCFDVSIDVLRFAVHEPKYTVQAAARLVPEKYLAIARWLKRKKINFGSFDKTTPICADFGYSRGLPIDRFYIERFLASQADLICGRVLEVGDASYSRKFGNGVTQQDVIHAHRYGPEVTIVGDLQTKGLLPPGSFDCIILTQTLHLIYDFRTALENLRHALKPSGSLLVTTPGITRIDRGEWKNAWYWSFTEASIRRIFREFFSDSGLSVEVAGNVYAATAFLQGLSQGDVDRAKLEPYDEGYPIIISVQARREADAPS
ncbi:MAG TPA: glycosyltransferase, partial [Beijerinckiaceae bacterium]|nr:glycosyltransferase [Beijerinckiaceae bacterium]